MGTYNLGQPVEISEVAYLDGEPTDATTATFTVLAPDGAISSYTYPGDAEVTNPDTGEYVLELGAPGLPGEYHYGFETTGDVVAVAKGQFNVLQDDVEPVAVTYPLHGPCQLWTDHQDVADCCGNPTSDVAVGSETVAVPVDMTPFAAGGTQLLYELSARQFKGVCERTIRPCSDFPCGVQVLARGHLVGWDGRYWGGRQCGCTPISQILLPNEPVRQIVEVLIDGEVLDESEYRLDGWGRLVRRRDAEGNRQVWPACQAMDLDDSEIGTFSVTYRHGVDVPIAGNLAAKELACQLYRACGSGSGAAGDCLLPSGVTSITRQGVTINKSAFASWGFVPPSAAKGGRAGGWQTGMALVDAFLNAYNPNGLRRPPAVWSPGEVSYGQAVGVASST